MLTNSTPCVVSAQLYEDDDLSLALFECLDGWEDLPGSKGDIRLSDITVSAEVYHGEDDSEGLLYASLAPDNGSFFWPSNTELDIFPSEEALMVTPMYPTASDCSYDDSVQLPYASIVTEAVPVATEYNPADVDFLYFDNSEAEFLTRKKRQLSGEKEMDEEGQIRKYAPATVVGSFESLLHKSKAAIATAGTFALQTLQQKNLNRSMAISRWLDKRDKSKALPKEDKWNARKEATSKRVRENGRFKKVSTAWIPVSELDMNNSNNGVFATCAAPLTTAVAPASIDAR